MTYACYWLWRRAHLILDFDGNRRQGGVEVVWSLAQFAFRTKKRTRPKLVFSIHTFLSFLFESEYTRKAIPTMSNTYNTKNLRRLLIRHNKQPPQAWRAWRDFESASIPPRNFGLDSTSSITRLGPKSRMTLLS